MLPTSDNIYKLIFNLGQYQRGVKPENELLVCIPLLKALYTVESYGLSSL